MKGYRTVIVAWISAVIVPQIIQHTGLVMDDDQKLVAAGIIMGGIMHVMRMITNGPLGGVKTLSQEQLKQVIQVIRAEVPRIIKGKPEPTITQPEDIP